MRKLFILGALAIGLSLGSLAISADGAAAAGCRGRGPGCTGPAVTVGQPIYSAFPNGNVVVNQGPEHRQFDSCQLFSEPPRNIVGVDWTTVGWGNRSQGCLPYVID